MQSQPWRHIQTIKLVVVSFGQIRIAAFYDHVAGGAGAATAAGVFELNAEVQRDIEDRLRLAVLVVRKLAVLELDGLVEIGECHLRHIFILAVQPARGRSGRELSPANAGQPPEHAPFFGRLHDSIRYSGFSCFMSSKSASRRRWARESKRCMLGGKTQVKTGTNFAHEAGQEIHLKAGMKVIIEAGVQISLKGPGGFIDIGPAGVTIQGTMVLINSGGAAGSGSGSSPKDADPVKPDQADDGTNFDKM